ncbi:DUF481 domain-containing protein [bacterium]|nr:DUF481 domain-containing protein [bacterium]
MRHYLLIVLLLLFSSTHHALVNTESLRSSKLPGTQQFLSLDIAAKSGNNSLFSFSPEYTLYITPYKRSLRGFLYGTLSNSTHKQKTIAQHHFIHARLIKSYSSPLELEYFIQHQANYFLNLNARYVTGLALRYSLDPLDQNFIISSGLMLEQEHYSNKRVQTVCRSSNYLITKHRISKTSILNTITYIQPKLDEFSDIRILSDVELNTKITELLSLSMSVEARYDNEPESSLEPLDLTFKQAIRVEIP